MASLHKTKSGFSLKQATKVDLPPDIFAEGKVKRWQALKHILSELVSAQEVAGMPAAICLPENLVRRQRVQLPLRSRTDDIQDLVNVHLQRDLPGMTDALCVDFVELRKAGQAYVEVGIAAARQEYLAQYEECVKDAGLAVNIVDVDIYAIQRAMCFGMQQVNALLYCVDGSASLIGFNDEDIMLYQQWDIDSTKEGLRTLYQQVQHYLSAQQHFKVHGLVTGGLSEWIDEAADSWSVCPIHKMTTLFDRGVTHVKPEEFVVAIGLAMREVPRW
jgi:Tfp pilus assembly PilM family ATPase